MSAACLDRLRSIVIQLPLAGLPPRVLEVGCGATPAASVLPGWTWYGVDLDREALGCVRRAAPLLHLIQADARGLPGLFRVSFGLVLLRHPDLIRHRAAWTQAIPALPALLPPGGVLLITLYAPEEVETLQALDFPPAYLLEAGTLVPCDLAGHDRFALAYRAATIQ